MRLFRFQYGTRYPWNKKEQSYILGAFFWGYLVTSLLGGAMAERWGGRHVVGISLGLSGLVTGLSPLMAADSFWPIFGARFALGVLGVSFLVIDDTFDIIIVSFIHALVDNYVAFRACGSDADVNFLSNAAADAIHNIKVFISNVT